MLQIDWWPISSCMVNNEFQSPSWARMHMQDPSGRHQCHAWSSPALTCESGHLCSIKRSKCLRYPLSHQMEHQCCHLSTLAASSWQSIPAQASCLPARSCGQPHVRPWHPRSCQPLAAGRVCADPGQAVPVQEGSPAAQQQVPSPPGAGLCRGGSTPKQPLCLWHAPGQRCGPQQQPVGLWEAPGGTCSGKGQPLRLWQAAWGACNQQPQPTGLWQASGSSR